LTEQSTNPSDLRLLKATILRAALETPTAYFGPLLYILRCLASRARGVWRSIVPGVFTTTVRAPQDLARVGNMNLLGMVPHADYDPNTAGSRLPLVIFDAPQSMMAESFRMVRAFLQGATSLDSTRSMLVISAGPGDGKTTVAVNLAAGLALNGRRILLVDANFRRPQLHNVFDTSNEYGFSDVLNALDQFEQCVQETAVPNLSVLTSGAKPANATELLESQLLTDFIDRALGDYDHVIFDAGPLPLVSETIALAPRVDGCITVVRARANSRRMLQQVRETLRQVKAEHLGVVLNAVTMRQLRNPRPITNEQKESTVTEARRPPARAWIRLRKSLDQVINRFAQPSETALARQARILDVHLLPALLFRSLFI
jgi:capsular exopolysaccharide synthesis family protein